MPGTNYRKMEFGVTSCVVRAGIEGCLYVRADQPLQAYCSTMTERLIHWGQATPRGTFLARRRRSESGESGEWESVSYGYALAQARAIGQALLNMHLSVDRPVVILSENGTEHALLALGCLYVGVPFCSVSPAYSTLDPSFEKLRQVLGILTPGLVFAADGARYGGAIQAAVPKDADVVVVSGRFPGRTATSWADLTTCTPTAAVDAAMRATGPETIAKFLFTSGSTKLPKAVTNTHRMWCSNQQQIRQCMPMFEVDAPILVDWLPWHHTFGGNHNFGLVLYNGGTLYIDDGKPTPAQMGETIRNLREISPTVYYNVPTGFHALAVAMRADAVLRKTLLARTRMFFYGGASLAQPVVDAMHEIEQHELGELMPMCTGLGMTESGPLALFVTGPDARSGDLGLPVPGLEVKLVPVQGKIEIRYRGPNVTPGYWRASAQTAATFDDEGFFCTGDAVAWIDPTDWHRGLRFDGRIAEDFKLATGTFVSVGPLRARIIEVGAPYVEDVVITGINRHEVGALVFPTMEVLKLAGLPDASLRTALDSPAVIEHFQRMLDEIASHATGSASRLARLHLVSDPPMADLGEITDKGSINQQAVLRNRSQLVEDLHTDRLPSILKSVGVPPL